MDVRVATRHVHVVTAGWPADAWIEFRALRPGHPPVRRFVRAGETANGSLDRTITWCAQGEAAGYDLYIGVNPRAAQEGTARAVVGYGVVIVDLDPHHVAGARDHVRALAAVGLRPSMVIRSGRPGAVHLYYLLDQIYPVDGARPVARRAVRYVGGDAVFDAPRVLRLAGSLNRKPGARMARIGFAAPGRRYTLDGVRRALDRVGAVGDTARAARIVPTRPWATALPVRAGGAVPALPWRRLSRRGRLAAIWRTPRDLGYPSRSERDAGEAARLARIGGWSIDRIAALLVATPLALGDKTRDDGEEYAIRTATWGWRRAWGDVG